MMLAQSCIAITFHYNSIRDLTNKTKWRRTYPIIIWLNARNSLEKSPSIFYFQHYSRSIAHLHIILVITVRFWHGQTDICWTSRFLAGGIGIGHSSDTRQKIYIKWQLLVKGTFPISDTVSQIGQVIVSQIGQITVSQIGKDIVSQLGEDTVFQIGPVFVSQIDQDIVFQIGRHHHISTLSILHLYPLRVDYTNNSISEPK